MKYVSTQQLLSGERRFDFFTQPIVPDDEILKRELYNPLPLTGNVLIWGFGLAEKAKTLGLKRLVCNELEETQPKELLRLALLLEGRAGRYTWKERENILNYMEQYRLQEAAGEISEWVENHRELGFVSGIIRYRGFPQALRQLLDDNLMDFKTAARVCDLPQCLFRNLLETRNRLSFSERRILSLYIFEIISRDVLSAGQAEELVRSVFAAKHPLADTVKLRYPGLSELEKDFNRFKEQNLKGSGITLSAPPYFEGPMYRLEFCFENSVQFVKKADRLARLKENIDELFLLLH